MPKPSPIVIPSMPWLAALYVGSYVTLESISYVHPFGAVGIIPWNPSRGLSILLVLMWGKRTLPLLFFAPLCFGVE